MSDADYIKKLEKTIESLQEVVSGKEAEIYLLKNISTTKIVKKLFDSTDRKLRKEISMKSFYPDVIFKFTINQDDISDVFSYYDQEVANKILDELIILATRQTIAENLDKLRKTI